LQQLHPVPVSANASGRRVGKCSDMKLRAFSANVGNMKEHLQTKRRLSAVRNFICLGLLLSLSLSLCLSLSLSFSLYFSLSLFLSFSQSFSLSLNAQWQAYTCTHSPKQCEHWDAGRPPNQLDCFFCPMQKRAVCQSTTKRCYLRKANLRRPTLIVPCAPNYSLTKSTMLYNVPGRIESESGNPAAANAQ
jgi:hypothetical protein